MFKINNTPHNSYYLKMILTNFYIFSQSWGFKCYQDISKSNYLHQTEWWSVGWVTSIPILGASFLTRSINPLTTALLRSAHTICQVFNGTKFNRKVRILEFEWCILKQDEFSCVCKDQYTQYTSILIKEEWKFF